MVMRFCATLAMRLLNYLLLQNRNEAGPSLRGANPSKLADDFHRSSRLLFKLLSTPSMQSRARAPYLRQLLLRLDFNGFVQRDTDVHAANAQAPPSAPPAPSATASTRA